MKISNFFNQTSTFPTTRSIVRNTKSRFEIERRDGRENRGGNCRTEAKILRHTGQE